MKKLGQESAFPSVENDYDEGREYLTYQLGISKRLYIATQILTMLIGEYPNTKGDVEAAYQYADELLKQENGEAAK